MKSKDNNLKEVKLIYNKGSINIINNEEGMYAEYVSHRDLKYKTIKVKL